MVKELIQEIQTFGNAVVSNGWAERNAGNLSVRLPADLILKELPMYPAEYNASQSMFLKSNNLLITAAESRMRDVAKNPLNYLVFFEKKFDDNPSMHTFNEHVTLKPSSELSSHVLIHEQLEKRRSKAIVMTHTHLTEIIALTHLPMLKNKINLNKLLFAMHPEIETYLPDGIGYVPFLPPGSSDLANKSALEFASHEIVVWEKHGVLAAASSPVKCLEIMELIAKAAKIFFLCARAGAIPGDFF